MTVAVSKQHRDFLPGPPASGSPEEQKTAEARHLAHDARNWLTVLQVYCDLLRASGTVVGEGRQWIEELSSAIERGQGLVRRWLDSAQAPAKLPKSSPQAVAPPKPLDLAAAIQTRMPLFREMAGSAIQVKVKTVARAGTTALQEPEFERILLNLVRNAIEAMPQGGTLRIALEHGSPSRPGSLVLRVSDTGKGIAAESLPHIFNSGFSTKRASTGPWLERGLGLAIVRELTMGAGGSARVRSRVGHGASFAIELPLVLPAPPAAGPRSAAPRQTKLAIVSEMPKPKTEMPKAGRHGQPNNFGANRKGTRVPC